MNSRKMDIDQENKMDYFVSIMITRQSTTSSHCSSLEDLLKKQPPLYKLSNIIDSNTLEKAFKPLYCSDNGRPASRFS